MACVIGPMDRSITIQSKTEARDAAGQPIETWADLATVDAEWIPQSGREFWGARQINAEATATFRIHYRTDVTVEHRISYNSRTWDIVEAEEDRRFGYKQFLLIRAVARVSA